jgi:hypothetical protein
LLLKAEAEDGIDAAFATLVRDKAGAVLVDADPFFIAKREQVLGWTKAHALPAIYSFREFAVDGGLMSYGTSLANAYHQAGVYAGWINKMAPKPGPFCVRRCLQHYRGSLIREIGADLSTRLELKNRGRQGNNRAMASFDSRSGGPAALVIGTYIRRSFKRAGTPGRRGRSSRRCRANHDKFLG